MSTDQPLPASATSGTSGRPHGGTNGMAVGGFVTGLLGALLSWIPIAGILLGIVGVVLSGIGLAKGRREGTPTGLATAGVVLGALAVVIAVVLVVVVVANA